MAFRSRSSDSIDRIRRVLFFLIAVVRFWWQDPLQAAARMTGISNKVDPSSFLGSFSGRLPVWTKLKPSWRPWWPSEALVFFHCFNKPKVSGVSFSWRCAKAAGGEKRETLGVVTAALFINNGSFPSAILVQSSNQQAGGRPLLASISQRNPSNLQLVRPLNDVASVTHGHLTPSGKFPGGEDSGRRRGRISSGGQGPDCVLSHTCRVLFVYYRVHVVISCYFKDLSVNWPVTAYV